MVSHHTLIHAVRSELHRSEFTTAISPQHVEFLAALSLRAHLELLDHRRRFVLARQELQPHVATAIIHEQEEVPPTTICGWRDWPAEIAVDELESVCCAILGRLWERQCNTPGVLNTKTCHDIICIANHLVLVKTLICIH